MPQTKVATCTYCGHRAALVLRGERSHELSCASCGAPLHDLKMLKTSAVDEAAHRPIPKKGRKAKGDVHATPLAIWEKQIKGDPRKRKKKNKKSLSRRLLGEAFDLLEDIFD